MIHEDILRLRKKTITRVKVLIGLRLVHWIDAFTSDSVWWGVANRGGCTSSLRFKEMDNEIEALH